MVIRVIDIILLAPWCHSLKEKRMVVQSLVGKLKHRFNISIIEGGRQDRHQEISIAIALLEANQTQADSIIDQIINYVENNSEASIVEIERDALFSNED